MSYIEPEVIIKAKQIDLLSYLQTHEPSNLIRLSHDTYCTKEHDSLKISNGKWCWWSRGIGGKSALDYLIKVKDYNFINAVEKLIGQSEIKPSAFSYTQKYEVSKEKNLLLPELSEYPKFAKEYLIGRGIDEEIIDYCIKNKSIREEKQYHNCLFIGFNKQGIAKYCSVRATKGDYKCEASGSDKHFSFKLFSNELKNSLHLFESAIDLLSYATLIKNKGCDWKKENLLSLAGIYMPQKNITESKIPIALTQCLNDYPKIKSIYLHLDNDKAGRLASAALKNIILPPYNVRDAPPPYGKDCNEYLLSILKLKNYEKKRSFER